MTPQPKRSNAVHVIHYAFKLALLEQQPPALDGIIPVFHGWIRRQALPDEVMIDVADYAHVAGGPGVLLVCHEGHYVLDRSRGAVGLSYQRKRGEPGPDAVAAATLPLQRLVRAARLLQDEPSLTGIAFDTTRLEVRVLDRLHAPNDDAGWAKVAQPLQQAIAAVWGHAPVLERSPVDPRAALSAWARLPATPLAALRV